MTTDGKRPSTLRDQMEGLTPELAELCRVHDVSLELIEHSHDSDQLLDRVLDEYERRLQRLSPGSLDPDGAPLVGEDAQRLRALMMFASQATALMQKAALATELRLRAGNLQSINDELSRALDDEERTRHRLDEVLAAVDSGIVIVGGDGLVQVANRAAADLTADDEGALVGRPVEELIGTVARGTDGEVVRGEGSRQRVWLVARRDLPGADRAEVVLISDVTQRERAAQESHRLEKVEEVFRTLAVLNHKINNPLTSLMGRAQLLKLNRTADPGVLKAIDVIEESARRIADLIREMTHVVKEGRAGALERLLDVPEKGGDGIDCTERDER